jgi:NAD(P)-dependent dehydrogenase (short-subunit alcohol dehydrogenase family)
MASPNRPLRVLFSAQRSGIVAAVRAVLLADGLCEAAGEGDEADVCLVDAFDGADEIPVLELDDVQFDAAFVEATLDRVADLQTGLARLPRPANIVVIGSDAYLGRWNGAAQASASAAMIGVVRSLAMEHARAGLRVNMLALPLEARADNERLLRDAAAQALTLLQTSSITGETVLVENGDNLKFRQARRR